MRLKSYFKVLIDAVSLSNYNYENIFYSTLQNTCFHKYNVLYEFGILLPVLWVFISSGTNSRQKACIQTFKLISIMFTGEELYNTYGIFVIFFPCCEILTYNSPVSCRLHIHALNIMANVTSKLLAKILKIMLNS